MVPLAEGIVEEADKLACSGLFLLSQFHSTIRAHVGAAVNKRQQTETLFPVYSHAAVL